MEGAKTRVNLVFLDACRNNPFSRRFRSTAGGLAKVDAASGTLISFATRPGSVAADGDGKNGLYTEYLLRNMQEPGLPIELMLKRVGSDVKLASKGKQEPWSEGLIEGDFYFRLASAASRPAMQASPNATVEPQASSGADERTYWTSVKDSSDVREIVAYLDQYPSGTFAGLARAKLGGKLDEGKKNYAEGARLQRALQFNNSVPAEAAAKMTAAYNILSNLGPVLDDEGKAQLGVLLISGTGNTPADPLKGLALLRPLAEEGNAIACNGLVIAFSRGLGVPKDEAESLKWQTLAANQGYATSQFGLGVRYYYGTGVTKDDSLAAQWFRKAANQDHASAQAWLGLAYANGRGVPKDENEAVRWFRKAIEQNNPFAQTSLAFMYMNGHGVPRDDSQAFSLLNSAANRGYSLAQANLGYLYETGRGVSKDEFAAVRLYQQAADQGDGLGQNNLGAMYEGGRGGLNKDLDRALALYKQAAEQGVESAKKNQERLKKRY
jgi:TPR repeat protein